MAEQIVYGYCDRCDRRGRVKELQLKGGKVNRFCLNCLKSACVALEHDVKKPHSDKGQQAEGDKPHSPFRHTQVD